MSQNEDIEALLDALVPFAEKMLRKHREFLPFGAHIKPDGEMVLDGAYDGEERPLSQDLIDILRESFRLAAERQELRACAVVYDIRTIPPGKSEKQDAICASIDHLDGYSAHVIYPYRFNFLGRLVVDEGFAIRGDASIFPASAPEDALQPG